MVNGDNGVLLDTLPERRTVTIHREISARRSIMPAGDGSKPRQGSEGGRSPYDHMRQIPFVRRTLVPPY